MPRRPRASVLAAVTLLWLSCAPSAIAHQGNPNYRSELDGIVPPVPGLDVQVLNYDDSLQLENRSGETVIVSGYQHEPYVRIAADGSVSVNVRSPAAYINDDRYGETKAPASADPKATPQWRRVDGTGQYVWHDHRIHYMGTATPGQVTDEDERTEIFDYRVPIEVAGKRAAITGTLYWVGEPGGFPLAPFAALGAVALIAATAIALRRRRRAPAEPGLEATNPARGAGGPPGSRQPDGGEEAW